MKHVLAKIMLGATVLGCVGFAASSVIGDMTGEPIGLSAPVVSVSEPREEEVSAQPEIPALPEEPAAQPEPGPQPQPEPEPAPQLDPEPEPDPQPQPEPKPVTPPPTEAVEERYVLNTNTKKIHFPDCSSVKTIKEKNRQDYTGSRQSLLDRGYEPCGRCKP